MNSDSSPSETLYACSFATELGWFCLLGHPAENTGDTPMVQGLVIGHADEEAAFEQATLLASLHNWIADSENIIEADWYPALRHRLCDYAAGLPVDFSDVQLVERRLTDFQQKVLARTRTLTYGQTITYGELAELAGRPRAARAVGSVMAGNTVPVIVPCHRVVASGGKFGGFSAPQGPELKKQMLKLEAEGSLAEHCPQTETGQLVEATAG
ncbi:MAG: methylated-DNA--[protein]-cysteine S-methyltransferase [Planctomycetaceae bacterium]|nr:methylated-DNA--[protein]-cysteine S-methyltransferase [Planctomycetaceae bacterium]